MKLDDTLLEDLHNLIEEFKWVKESIEKREEPTDFGYDNWTDAFNNYLNELYDLGDNVTISRGFSNTEKFLWVG